MRKATSINNRGHFVEIEWSIGLKSTCSELLFSSGQSVCKYPCADKNGDFNLESGNAKDTVVGYKRVRISACISSDLI